MSPIVAAGSAGLSAALYAARRGLSAAMVAAELDGQPQRSGKVGNHLGMGLIAGPELTKRFRDHAGRCDIDAFGRRTSMRRRRRVQGSAPARACSRALIIAVSDGAQAAVATAKRLQWQ